MFLRFFLITCLALNLTQLNAKDYVETFKWKKRVIVIFTPDTTHPEYVAMQDLLQSQKGNRERELRIFEIIGDQRVKLQGAVQPHLGAMRIRRDFEVEESVFKLILIGKDGDEKLNTATAKTASEIYKIIDAMPMRQAEMKRKKR